MVPRWCGMTEVLTRPRTLKVRDAIAASIVRGPITRTHARSVRRRLATTMCCSISTATTAKSAGMGDVFGHGMLSMAYLAQALRRMGRRQEQASATGMRASPQSRRSTPPIHLPRRRGRDLSKPKAANACARLKGRRRGPIKNIQTLDGEAVRRAATRERRNIRRLRKLEGKIAIISGSGRGIGRAAGAQAGRRKARASSSTISTKRPRELRSSPRSRRAGGNAVACVGNVTAEDFGERFVKTAHR